MAGSSKGKNLVYQKQTPPSKKDYKLYVDVQLSYKDKSTQITVKVDSGCSAYLVVPKTVVKLLGLEEDKETSFSAILATGEKVSALNYNDIKLAILPGENVDNFNIINRELIISLQAFKQYDKEFGQLGFRTFAELKLLIDCAHKKLRQKEISLNKIKLFIHLIQEHSFR